MYEARTHGSVRGMMLDLIIQHHPTRFRLGSALIKTSHRFYIKCLSDKSISSKQYNLRNLHNLREVFICVI